MYCSLTHVLVLAHHNDPIGHRHVQFVLIVPMIRATIAVRQMVQIVVVLAGRLDALRHAHLLANILHVMTFLEHRVLLKAVGERRTGHC